MQIVDLEIGENYIKLQVAPTTPEEEKKLQRIDKKNQQNVSQDNTRI